jgi:hypothetical protein
MNLSNFPVLHRAHILSLISYQCYQPPEHFLKTTPADTDLEGMRSFMGKTNPPTFISMFGAQAYVISNKTDVVVCCRGTEIKDSNDMHANLNTMLTQHHQRGLVHKGFYAEYHKVIDQIKLALVKHNPKSKKTVWVCGHSLGGAMAHLVASEINPSGGLYTYGQPRVGDSVFLSLIKFPYYRFVNCNDVVPNLPPSFLGAGFRHGGTIQYINSHGEITDCTRLQRCYDRIVGQFRALKKFQMFNGIRDHAIRKYHLIIKSLISHKLSK